MLRVFLKHQTVGKVQNPTNPERKDVAGIEINSFYSVVAIGIKKILSKISDRPK